MNVLHTSDWHLGKKLDGKSRMLEQRAVLAEITAICDAKAIDIVIIAGDVFDTVNPAAEAEELFYSCLVRLGANRVVVVLAGNHDNPERLCAPTNLAKACNIVLCGGMDNSAASRQLDFWANGSIVGGNGYISVIKGDSRVNLALLPYPSLSRMSGLGFTAQFDEYSKNVDQWIKVCCEGFTDGDYNIFASHLFMGGSSIGDELELGTAALVPTNILPDCHYVALGHVHKPQKVSTAKNAYYSGSILNYSFDEKGDKFVNILSCKNNSVALEKHKLVSGKKTVKVEVTSFSQAIEFVSSCDGWVQVLYNCDQPLSASKLSELRAYENFCSITNIFKADKLTSVKPRRTDSQMFSDFYQSIKGEVPSADIMDMFIKALSGEEDI